jgi:hypothetical protein
MSQRVARWRERREFRQQGPNSGIVGMIRHTLPVVDDAGGIKGARNAYFS